MCANFIWLKCPAPFWNPRWPPLVWKNRWKPMSYEYFRNGHVEGMMKIDVRRHFGFQDGDLRFGKNRWIFKQWNGSIMIMVHDFSFRSKWTPCQISKIKFNLFLALRPNHGRTYFSAQCSYEHFYKYLLRVFFADCPYSMLWKIKNISNSKKILKRWDSTPCHSTWFWLNGAPVNPAGIAWGKQEFHLKYLYRISSKILSGILPVISLR